MHEQMRSYWRRQDEQMQRGKQCDVQVEDEEEEEEEEVLLVAEGAVAPSTAHAAFSTQTSTTECH